MQTGQPFYLAGQTGTGKTSVALAVARLIPATEIINADAYQVYRGMEILSAAPSAEERDTCPHHLFGILDPSEECDVAMFAARAKQSIDEVLQRGGFPLVVGGSGLYLKAITHGLAPTPKGDRALRNELDQLDLDTLVERYRRLDPEGAKQTNLRNRRYVTRNLEICLLSGKPASRIKSEWRDNAPRIQAAYLRRSREDIYSRIERRTEQMFELGVIEEVEKLSSLSATASKAIGLREIRSHLSGAIDLATCRDEIRKITRRYAKRQETWFRREPAFLPIEAHADSPPTGLAETLTALPSRDPDPRPSRRGD